MANSSILIMVLLMFVSPVAAF